MYSDIHLRIYLSHERRLARSLEKRRLARERKGTTTTPSRDQQDRPRRRRIRQAC